MAEYPVQIGIAVVEHERRFLVGVRGPESPLPGKAEFPGGKCLPDESPRDCAVRECREEAGLAVTPVELLLQREFTYPHGAVALNFWLCRPAAQDVLAPHGGFVWVDADDLPGLDFPEANAPLVALLVERFASS